MAGKLLQAAGFQTSDGTNWERKGSYGVWDGERFSPITASPPFEVDRGYTAFEILTITQFKGRWREAVEWVLTADMGEQPPYLRIGVDYFKRINTPDRYRINGFELKKWSRQEIELDHGKEYLRNIPRYDNFCIEPDNLNFKPVIGNCYNLYAEFRHTPERGKWTWTERIMAHVFGDQFDLGLKYLQALYLYPDKALPILVLVSRERMTGKTTFLNWLNMIFGANMVVIAPDDLIGSFNSVYARSNIIGIEETMLEKALSIEKLKSLSTGKFISVNAKYIAQYKIPFFGKIILTSNNEDKFAKIDDEEIRFFIRKLGEPKFNNHNIEDDLVKEIPAFLHHLTTLPALKWDKSRQLFTTEELNNASLKAVKKESKSWLFKELCEEFEDHFINFPFEWTYCTPIDIKDKWFPNNHQVTVTYIRQVLKNEFKIEAPAGVISYSPFNQDDLLKRVGRAYMVKRDMFIED